MKLKTFKHTKSPWVVEGSLMSPYKVKTPIGTVIARIPEGWGANTKANAVFIAQACNAYDPLAEAILKLMQAWDAGAEERAQAFEAGQNVLHLIAEEA